MTKVDKWVNFFCGATLLLIGFFSGVTYERTKIRQYESTNAELGREVVLQGRSIAWWKDGYMRRDSALHRISEHKDCTFKLKNIIGDVN